MSLRLATWDLQTAHLGETLMVSIWNPVRFPCIPSMPLAADEARAATDTTYLQHLVWSTSVSKSRNLTDAGTNCALEPRAPCNGEAVDDDDDGGFGAYSTGSFTGRVNRWR